MLSTIQSHIQADHQWLDIESHRIATVLRVIYRGWEMSQMSQNVQSGTEETVLNDVLGWNESRSESGDSPWNHAKDASAWNY